LLAAQVVVGITAAAVALVVIGQVLELQVQTQAQNIS
jgi:hypothetical protein